MHLINKNKILLVQPPFSEKNVTSLEKYAPTGLIAIAGYARENNKDTNIEIYDASIENNPSVETITKFIIDNNTEILGLTGMTTNIESALKIAGSIKKNKPGITIIVGGIHTTIAPEEVLSNPAVDFIVIGEGEITFDELLKNINNPENYKNIAGLGFKENGKIIINERRKLIENISSLPIPAYDLLKIEKYKSPYGSRSPFVSVIRSRGCPFQCIFCGVQNMFGRVYRIQDPERTIQEIDYLINKFHVREIAFKDSEFTLNSQNVFKFCDLLIEKNYDLVWSCNARVDCGSFELYQKMKKAGCHTIAFGAESGDQIVLDTIKKGITIQQIKRAVKDAKKAKIKASLNFMIGSPGETKETIMKTIKLAKELNPDYVAFSFTTPFLGTELREMAIKNNWLIDKNLTTTTYMGLSMNATNLSNEELKKYMKKAYQSFYFRPSYILRRLTMLKKEDIKMSLNGFWAIVKSFFRKKTNA